jgi:hypothetical protein
MTTILDRQVEAMEIKTFLKMLDKIDNAYSHSNFPDVFWREYAYQTGKILNIVLMELNRLNDAVEILQKETLER